MKRWICVLLIVALMLGGAYMACALAEGEEGAPKAPLVDLTGALVAVLAMVFDFLLAWIAKVIVPPIRGWLEVHTTEKQKHLIWDAVVKLVDAAEQTIRGPGRGEERLAYVEAGLIERGFKIDGDLIEAAVKRMKDRSFAVLAEGLEIRGQVDETE